MAGYNLIFFAKQSQSMPYLIAVDGYPYLKYVHYMRYVLCIYTHMPPSAVYWRERKREARKN